MNKKNWTDIVAVAYILMFSYAASSKLFNLDLFAMHMRRQPFHPSLVPYLVWGVPTAEIVIVLLLIFPRFRIFGLKLGTALMFAFTGYITLAEIGFFKNLPCSCGGVIGKLSWGEHLVFNLFFLLIGVIALLIHFKKNTESIIGTES